MSDRLRYVLDDPTGSVVCLNDVVMAFANTSEKLRHIEYKNTAHSLREAKKAFRIAENLMIAFKMRLKDEITEEVATALAKVDKRVDPNNKEQREEFFGE